MNVLLRDRARRFGRSLNGLSALGALEFHRYRHGAVLVCRMSALHRGHDGKLRMYWSDPQTDGWARGTP